MIKAEQIWVFHDNSYVDGNNYTCQMLSKAYELSEMDETEVVVVCIDKATEIEKDLFNQYGANRLIQLETEKETVPFQFCQVMELLLLQMKPSMIMFPHNKVGQRVSAYVSVKFEAGMVAECIDLKKEKDNYVFFRTAMSQTTLAQIICVNSEFSICTVKYNAFLPVRLDRKSEILVESFPVELSTYMEEAEVIEINSIRKESLRDINDYKLVFGIGRGVGTEKGLELAFKLAEKYRGVVGCSRSCVEEGLMEYPFQIGQSGKTIRPQLYICFGISGASQHIVGMKDADCGIAVNTDENARIFDYLNYKIVDDAYEIMKELFERY